jgi:hypothetical protein
MAEKGNVFFDLVNDMFACNNIEQRYTYETFKQYQFMINRTVAIKYPREANMLNLIGMDPKYSAYTLNGMLYNGRGKEPWVFTKGAKKLKEENAKKKKVSPKLIRDYCAWYNKDLKDVEFAMKLYETEMVDELLEFEAMIKKSTEK